jgi:hypothetical protein
MSTWGGGVGDWLSSRCACWERCDIAQKSIGSTFAHKLFRRHVVEHSQRLIAGRPDN